VPFWTANKDLGIRNPRSLLPHHPLILEVQICKKIFKQKKRKIKKRKQNEKIK